MGTAKYNSTQVRADGRRSAESGGKLENQTRSRTMVTAGNNRLELIERLEPDDTERVFDGVRPHGFLYIP